MEEMVSKIKDMAKDEFRDIINKGHMTPMDVDMSTKLLCLIEKAENYLDDEGYSKRSYMNPHESYRMRSYKYDDRKYSGHDIKDRMIDSLERMMVDAKTDHEKEIVNKWIDRISGD